MKAVARIRRTWPMWVFGGASLLLAAWAGSAASADAGGSSPSAGHGGSETAESVRLQSHCPMMGGVIDREVFTDVDGKRIYFCCAACIEPFLEDAAALIAKMEDTGITFDEAPLSQPLCPVSGKDVEREIHADYGESRVYFCSDPCREEFERDPEPYIHELSKDGVTLEPAPGAAGGDGHNHAHEEGGQDHGHAQEEDGHDHGHAHEEGGHDHEHHGH